MLKDRVLEYADLIYDEIKDNLKTVDNIYDINSTNGRFKESPEYSKKSSYIYFLYNQDGKVIYIGETGQKLKNRLFTDGSGSHQNNKKWFDDIAYLKYYKDDNMDNYTRRAVERLLIIKFNPINNSK